MRRQRMSTSCNVLVSAGHVRRGDNDRERIAVRVGPAVEVALLVPELQPALLGLAGVVLRREFFAHGYQLPGDRVQLRRGGRLPTLTRKHPPPDSSFLRRESHASG